jgi:hypothetical protein
MSSAHHNQQNFCTYAGCKAAGLPNHQFKRDGCLLDGKKEKYCISRDCVLMNIAPHKENDVQCVSDKSKLIQMSLEGIDSIKSLEDRHAFYAELIKKRKSGMTGSTYINEKKMLSDKLNMREAMNQADLVNEHHVLLKKHMEEEEKEKKMKYDLFTDVKGVDKSRFEKYCESGKRFAVNYKTNNFHKEHYNKNVSPIVVDVKLNNNDKLVSESPSAPANEHNSFQGNTRGRGRGRGRSRGRGRGRGRGQGGDSRNNSDNVENNNIVVKEINDDDLEEQVNNLAKQIDGTKL